MSEAVNRTAGEALAAFERATGLRVHAIHEADSDALWWAEEGVEGVFRCSVGDRVMHVDELCAPPRGNRD